MKTIRLIETKITNSQAPEGSTLEYRREFLRMVELVPEGLTASQMGVAIKLAAKLQGTETGNNLFLEDAEWEYLNNKVKTAKFQLISPEIVAMAAAVETAESCDAPHLIGGTEEETQTASA